MTRRTSLDAVKEGKHFTQSAGLLAVHPIAEPPKDEYFYFARLLRCEAFLRFNYDHDAVFSEKAGDYGFREWGAAEFPGSTYWICVCGG